MPLFKKLFSVHTATVADVVPNKQYKSPCDSCGCQKVMKITCLCVPSCLSFSKASNGHTGDASLSMVKDQSGHNYSTAKIYGALPRDRFLCQWPLTTALQDVFTWTGLKENQCSHV